MVVSKYDETLIDSSSTIHFISWKLESQSLLNFGKVNQYWLISLPSPNPLLNCY